MTSINVVVVASNCTADGACVYGKMQKYRMSIVKTMNIKIPRSNCHELSNVMNVTFFTIYKHNLLLLLLSSILLLLNS